MISVVIYVYANYSLYIYITLPIHSIEEKISINLKIFI